ncbi:MAG TPA: GNAT family N-acetyltransferase [Clostridia bacterium]|nr:GNAT family N-acetyltransferase [Clostridia bacterium]
MLQQNLYSYSFDDGEHIEFRLLSSNDSIEELTQLLHKSYKVLADMGLKYVAAAQDSSITLSRTSQAYKCYIGIHKNMIVSTISLYSPKPSDNSSWYNKDFVAKFGQFAVAPELQRYGIGGKMLDIVEEEARRINGVRELALDTAETAYHLIGFYKKRGYRYVETIKWDVTNYRSVVLSKPL